MATLLRSNLPTDQLDISVGDFDVLDLPPRERGRGVLGHRLPLGVGRRAA